MSIQILPPQLANQIAAGEVVERPASVVKELVENSLDAGATDIRIEIENGGAGLIRIRDNGIGIAKEELHLALARHATSKITCLEDLEAILSLGFRGEALASISSVSRLTLISRTQEQNEAWLVYAQGREMEATIKPAAHPVGTTVEVANLFFNTPARRKFLRTDKTEFNHIDEIIRRIALAKPQISFSLSHNGKVIRHYKNALNPQQTLKRLAAICGDDFVQNALQIDWKLDDLHLHGWVAQPHFHRPQNDLSYCYVNGRMVRDKVINHAIKQAYGEYLSNDQHPAFVLFIDLNPNEVDVNVHPTKHEVRFHQARLIHDFIYQGISNALSSEHADGVFTRTEDAAQVTEPQARWNSMKTGSAAIKPNRAAAGTNIFNLSPSAFPTTKQRDFAPHFSTEKTYTSPSKTEQTLYAQLIQTSSNAMPISPASDVAKPASNAVAPRDTSNDSFLRTLALIENKALLLQQNQQFYLLPLADLQRIKMELSLQVQNVLTQPLLIPVVFRLNERQLSRWQQQKTIFEQVGFEFSENLSQYRITLNGVPGCLRQQNLQKLVISLLAESIEKTTEFLTALCRHAELDEIHIFADAVNLLGETEQLLNKQTKINLKDYFISVDFNQYLASY